MWAQLVAYNPRTAYEQYWESAGEVEARRVQAQVVNDLASGRDIFEWQILQAVPFADQMVEVSRGEFYKLKDIKKEGLEKTWEYKKLNHKGRMGMKLALSEIKMAQQAANPEVLLNPKETLTQREMLSPNFQVGYWVNEQEGKAIVDKAIKDGDVSVEVPLTKYAGMTATPYIPDNLLVGNVWITDAKGNWKHILEGEGGVVYILKYGNVWASSNLTTIKKLAKELNRKRRESPDGVGRLVLMTGKMDKLLTSPQGVVGGMKILEELVEKFGLRREFQRGLIEAKNMKETDKKSDNYGGPKYPGVFSKVTSEKALSSKALHKAIEESFINVSDSTFEKRGYFLADVLTAMGVLVNQRKDKKQIMEGVRDFLRPVVHLPGERFGMPKRMTQFTAEGIRNAIGNILTENMLRGLPSGHAYAVVEYSEDLVYEEVTEGKGAHPSYPWILKQESGKRPKLNILHNRAQYDHVFNNAQGMNKEQVGEESKRLGKKKSSWDAEIGGAQTGFGDAIFKSAADLESTEKATDNKIEGVTQREQMANHISDMPTFLKWYKGSKLVSPTGKPILLYHGTSKEAAEAINAEGFKIDKSHRNLQSVFFMTDPAYTESYQRMGRERFSPTNQSGLVYAFAKMTNPMTSEKNAELRGRIVKEVTGKEWGSPDVPWTKLKLYKGRWKTVDSIIDEKVVSEAKRQGYDGLYDPNGVEVHVFDTKAIKTVDESFAMLTQREQLEIAGQPGSQQTQRGTATIPTYVKIAEGIKQYLGPMGTNETAKVLDYGAGEGVGADAMQKILGDQVTVEALEVFPVKWRAAMPLTYTSNTEIQDKFNVIVSANVFNVVERGIRDEIIKDIYKSLEPGGLALITARNSIPFKPSSFLRKGAEEKGVFLRGQQGHENYQKPFKTAELKANIYEVLGDDIQFVEPKSLGQFGDVSSTHVAFWKPTNTLTQREQLGTMKDPIWQMSMEEYVGKSFDELNNNPNIDYDEWQQGHYKEQEWRHSRAAAYSAGNLNDEALSRVAGGYLVPSP